MRPTPTDQSPARPAPSRKEMLIWIGSIALLCALLFALPTLTRPSRQVAAGQFASTVDQARARLQALCRRTGCPALDNEVLRQVAFPGQGRPVSPRQPLVVRDGIGGLGAISVEGRKGHPEFAIIVSSPSQAECKALVARFPQAQIQVDGIAASPGADECVRYPKLVRMVFEADRPTTPPARS